MAMDVDVVVVGAGPYGLSVAAHLRAKGVNFRIFGEPMKTWTSAMPKGMFLKSEGFASSLFDPARELTLAKYCAKHALEYSDIGTPVPLETFIAYGLEFQERFVPDLDQRSVAGISEEEGGFKVRLDDAEEITTRSVVLAVGISGYAYTPPNLTTLPSEYVSHSSTHIDLDEFADRDVALIGAGSSAIDLAMLLRNVGARPVIVARAAELEYHNQPVDPRPLFQRVLRPLSCIGQDWRRRVFTDVPLLFHALPQMIRLREIRVKSGPSGGWFTKSEVDGHVPVHLSREVSRLSLEDGKVQLTLTGSGAPAETLTVDHVIAATGYRVDVNRLDILPETLRSKVATVDDAPTLSANFESSVPGLYFVGVAAMNSFGPVFRFACGAEYTASHLSRHLAKTFASRSSVGATTSSS